jgi:hypothetical protein
MIKPDFSYKSQAFFMFKMILKNGSKQSFKCLIHNRIIILLKKVIFDYYQHIKLHTFAALN